MICSVNVDGSNYKEYKTGTGSPLIVSFTRSENILFWITQYNGKMKYLLVSIIERWFLIIPADGIMGFVNWACNTILGLVNGFVVFLPLTPCSSLLIMVDG